MIIELKNLVIGVILLVCFCADHRKHLLFPNGRYSYCYYYYEVSCRREI